MRAGSSASIPSGSFSRLIHSTELRLRTSSSVGGSFPADPRVTVLSMPATTCSSPRKRRRPPLPEAFCSSPAARFARSHLPLPGPESRLTLDGAPDGRSPRLLRLRRASSLCRSRWLAPHLYSSRSFTFASNEFLALPCRCFTLESDGATSRSRWTDSRLQGDLSLAPETALAGIPLLSPLRSSAHNSGERDRDGMSRL